jgi:hypothetical protein
LLAQRTDRLLRVLFLLLHVLLPVRVRRQQDPGRNLQLTHASPRP